MHSQVVQRLEVRNGVKLTKMCHLFSLEISFFEILVNFGVIFTGEGVEIAKLGVEYWEKRISRAVQISNQFLRILNGC
jgi:hypothetical protein